MKEDIANKVREEFVDISMRNHPSLADKVEAIADFYSQLSIDDKPVLEKVVVDLLSGTKQVYSLLLVERLRLASAEPVLLSMLGKNENTKLVILAIGALRNPDNYNIILDYCNTHDHQAIIALASMNKDKTLSLVEKMLGESFIQPLTLTAFFETLAEVYGINVAIDAKNELKKYSVVDKAFSEYFFD